MSERARDPEVAAEEVADEATARGSGAAVPTVGAPGVRGVRDAGAANVTLPIAASADAALRENPIIPGGELPLASDRDSPPLAAARGSHFSARNPTVTPPSAASDPGESVATPGGGDPDSGPSAPTACIPASKPAADAADGDPDPAVSAPAARLPTSDPADGAPDEASDPAAAVLLGISSMIRIERALWVAARLGVADHLDPPTAAPKPVLIETLAATLDVDADALCRVLRALAGAGIFAEPSPRAFVATTLSAPLRSDSPDSVRDAIVQQGGEEEWRAWGEILHTVRTGEAAFEHVWGRSPWEYYASTRSRMTQVSRSDSSALASHPLLAGADHIVDVGGGEGDFLAAVLAAHPEACGTLFDLAAIVETAAPRLEAAGVLDRCEIIGGDIFASVPSGGDLYLLKRVIHDWNDEDALAILRSIRRAIPDHGRLVILTALLPGSDAPSSALLSDLALMVMLGGRHRTAAEMGALLLAADLEIEEVIDLPSPLSAIVARVRDPAAWRPP